MKAHPLSVFMMCTLIMAMLFATATNAQDREIGNARAVFIANSPYNALMLPNSMSQRLGWNWGMPMSRFSDALNARTMHYAFGWSLVNNFTLTWAGVQFRDSTTTSTTDTVFLFPHIRTAGISISGELGVEEYKCMRFDPEITVQKKNFVKDAAASPGATFGFQYRHADLGVSGTRVTLDDADFAADDTTLVLADVWPDSAMHTRFPRSDLQAIDANHLKDSGNPHRYSMQVY